MAETPRDPSEIGLPVPVPYANQSGAEFARLARSFACAGRGLREVLATQRNARIHLAAAIVSLGLGLWLRLSALEFALVLGAIVAVGAAEAFNTAIEATVDLASPALHPLARRAKDVAAGAVLLCAVGAVAIGLCIFGPALLTKFQS